MPQPMASCASCVTSLAYLCNLILTLLSKLKVVWSVRHFHRCEVAELEMPERPDNFEFAEEDEIQVAQVCPSVFVCLQHKSDTHHVLGVPHAFNQH